MPRAFISGLTILWLAASTFGCDDSNDSSAPAAPAAGTGTQAPSATAASGAAAGASDPPAMSGGSGAAATTAGAVATPAAAGRSGAAADSGGTPSAGASAPAAGPSASAGNTAAAGTGPSAAAGASAGSAGAAANAGAAGMPPSAELPPPVTEPQVYGYMIGITDVPAAVKFYTEVMKMTVEKDSVKRDGRTDTRLYSTQAMRGGRVVLMKFDDTRETRKITAKLVWQAQNTSAVNQAASMYPDYVSRLNLGIVQFDGPETYIQEIGGGFDTTTGATSITVPYPIALGFAVSDQPAARMFYTALGMTESPLGTFTVTDASGTASITEYTVKYAAGPGVVLQAWNPMRNAKDNPVGVILLVPDAQAVADKAVAAGGMIVKPAERSAVYDNRLLIVMKDLDGYILEILQ